MFSCFRLFARLFVCLLDVSFHNSFFSVENDVVRFKQTIAYMCDVIISLVGLIHVHEIGRLFTSCL